MQLTENKLRKIINEEAHKIVNEGFFNNLAKKAREFSTGIEELDGDPQSASQVMYADGWTGKTVSKDPNGIIIRCYAKTVGINSQVNDFEEMIDDLNNYYSSKHLPLYAEGFENYNNEEGLFLKVSKQ